MGVRVVKECPIYWTVKTFTICEKKLGSPSDSKNRRLERRTFKCKTIHYYIGYQQIILSRTWSDSRVISETFSVSDVTWQYIYYFQWELWQRTIPIYKVFDCKIFKSFSIHCSLLLTMLISLNYFAIYIIQKTKPCLYSFTFYLYRYHLFLISVFHERYYSLQLSMVIYKVTLLLQLVQNSIFHRLALALK